MCLGWNRRLDRRQRTGYVCAFQALLVWNCFLSQLEFISVPLWIFFLSLTFPEDGQVRAAAATGIRLASAACGENKHRS